MSVFEESRFTGDNFLREVQVGCSWCDCVVPLPAGDFSGVCIECGAVVFRPATLRGKRETVAQTVSSLPCPA